MSLDGFIAGPDDSMEWAFGYAGRNRCDARIYGDAATERAPINVER